MSVERYIVYFVKLCFKSNSYVTICLFIAFDIKTESVWCVVGVRHRAVTRVKQLGAGSVFGWVTAGPRPAYQNAEREIIFPETVDCGDRLCGMADCIDAGFPPFSCALVQMRYSIGENGCGHILKGGTFGGKTVKERGTGGKEERGNGGGDM